MNDGSRPPCVYSPTLQGVRKLSAPRPAHARRVLASNSMALRAAIEAGDASAVRAELAARPETVRVADETTRWTCLHVATKANACAIVELLLDAGADVAATTHHDSTALHIAACNGLDEIATLLILRGCPLEARDNKGNTALVRAGQHGHAGVASRLLDARADVGARNAEGQSAVDRAQEGGHDAVLSLLHAA